MAENSNTKRKRSSVVATVVKSGENDAENSTSAATQQKQARIGDVAMPNGDGTLSEPEEEATLAASFAEQVRPFIDLIDDLRCHGLDKDLSLPSVVVIGDQSSGKSSILEAISGVQLPRGSGIVTRCPLEMQLKKTSGPPKSWFARLTYMTKNGNARKIDIKKRGVLDGLIRKAQDEIAGDSKGISPSLITLRVESPSSPDLTLIDLPGIARTPVEGQPLDICQQIKFLLTDHIRKSNTIILCVLPSNVDIATNEALSMAKEVDPDGARTLGVLTKPDLIDKGMESDVIAILNNEKFVLKKGYLIVRCRGQLDIQNNIDLATALAQESNFFERHHIFCDIPEEMRGTKQLSQKLSTILVEHIQNTLPAIRNDVRLKLEATRKRIEMLGEGPCGDECDKRLFLMKLLEVALNNIKKLLIDSRSITNESIDLKRRGLNPHVTYNSAILWRGKAERLKKQIDEVTADSFKHGFLSDARVEEKLRLSRGNELPGFTSYEVFQAIVKEHVAQYRHFSRDFLERISDDVEELVGNVFKECYSRLPNARSKCRGIAEEVRETCKAKAYELLDLELRRENLIYTQDETFKTEMTHLSPFNTNDSPKITREMLDHYLKIANRRFLDNIPLLFRLNLHYDFFEALQKRLQKLFSGPDIISLAQEDPQAMAERKQLHDRIKRLSHASIELSYKL